MRSQIERLIDLCGLLLSGMILIVVLTELHNLTNPLVNYRETGIDDSLRSLLILGFMLLLAIIQAIALIHRFWAERRSLSPEWWLFRLLIPTLILCAFLFGHHPFPGVSASAAVRQEWARREFQDFNFVAKSIRQCREIVDRVGQVTFVAPTDGRNYVYYDPGSSGHQGELTLEVVGDKATGVAKLKYHIYASVAPMQFTHHGKTESLNCKNLKCETSECL
ncbi:MAG: hypothetical protein C4288_09185 [Leptolyngbya sp. ERB_1_1]